jgi:spore coat protein CotF
MKKRNFLVDTLIRSQRLSIKNTKYYADRFYIIENSEYQRNLNEINPSMIDRVLIIV